MGGVILGALLALAGCQSEKLVDDSGSQQGQQFSLTATKGTKNIGSRTAIVSGQTIWSLDDEIYVSSEDGKVTGVLKINPSTLSQDKTTATFTGYVFGDPSKLAYSVFPAPKNGNIIDLSTIEGGGEVDAPFIGKINQDDDVDVHFNHVGGVAPIIKNNYQGGEIVINATNNNSTVKFLKELDVTKVDLSGNEPVFIIDNTSKETETIKITSPKGGQMYVPYYLKSSTTANQEGKKIVEFKHGEDVVNRADLTDGFVGKVHASTVVAYTYKENGTSVENKSTEPELKEEGGTSTAVVNKNQFSSINEPVVGEDPEETKYFNVSAVVTKPVEGEAGKTETVVAEAVEVTLPKVEVSEGNEEAKRSVEISFTNVTSSTTITIQEEEATSPEGEKSIDNLTIVLPSGTTAEEAKEAVNINMPNTTVTVKSDDGQILLINEMTVATADKTLVIGEDVEITKLTIKKGNVQVFGKVGEIKRDPKNEDKETVLTIEKGGQVNKVDGKDKITVIDNNKTSDAEHFEDTVNTFAELQNALKYAGGIITIGRDFEITAPLTNSGEFEINMQGHTLTIAEGLSANVMAVIINNNLLEVNNGTFQANSSDIKYFIHNTQGSTLKMVGVDIMASGMYGGILNDGDISVHEYILNGKTSTIEAKGLAINNGGNISIKNGIIVGNVENLNQGTFVIEQGKINGDLTTSSPKGTITIGEGVEINGKNWPDGSEGGEIGSTGTPVSTFAELKTALDNADITNITITQPIEISGTLNIGSKIITLSNTLFETHETNAAFIVTGDLFISGDKGSGKITGSSNIADKYMFEAISKNISFNGVIVETTGQLNALYVQDAQLTTSNRTNIKSKNGYALDMISEKGSANANINDGSVVEGQVHYLLNNVKTSSRFVVDSSSVTGKFTHGGNGGLKMLEISTTNKGTITGEGWEEQQPDYSGTFEGPVKNYNELVEALKYSEADIVLETSENEFHITGPLIVNGTAQINWAQNETVYIDESVNASAVFTNNGNLTINASDGKLENNSSATLFSNSSGGTLRIQCVDITSYSAKYDIWNEGEFSILSDDDSDILTEISLKAIYNTGGSLTVYKANINADFTNQQGGKLTIKEGTITGKLDFHEASSGNQEAYISISNSANCVGTGWDDERIVRENN